MTGQGVLFRGVGVKCDATPAGKQELMSGYSKNVLGNKGQGVRERRRGEKCFYVFQSLRTERAAVSMSGIPPAVEPT